MAVPRTSLWHIFALFADLFTLTWRRLFSRPALTLLALLGVILAVGLLTSAGFFAQAVDRVILGQELEKLSQSTGRIPFSTRVYYLPSRRKPLAVTEAETVAKDVGDTLASEIGLPLAHLGLHVESGGLMLIPMPEDTRYNKNAMLETVNVVYIAEAADYLNFPAGEPLGEYPPSALETLDVWMHASLAAQMGVRVGENFQVAVNLRQAPRKVHIRGLWQAKDINDRFWFANPDTTLRTGLLTTRGGYIGFVEPMIAAKTAFASWSIRLDESQVNPAQAAQYANGFERGMSVINQYLPGAKLDSSPLDPLKLFVQRQSALVLTLLGFNLPALAFLLYFLLLVALILARWQRRETALLVSRGMSFSMVLGLTLLEEALLFVLGVPLGIALGLALASGMGETVSFLRFANRPPLPVSLQGINYSLIAVGLLVALLARLLPVWGAARESVVTQAREGSRPLRPPFWQRIYLDFVLIVPSWYVYDQLAQRGTLAADATNADEFLRDPLLVLAPALAMLTAALLVMRLFPLLLRLLDLLASRTPWLTLHMALRQLGRASQSYINPLLLVIVALGMGVYTRSMAASLDQWLVDRVYYRVGTDAVFTPIPPAGPEQSGGATTPADPPPGWIPPKAEFATLPGVERATGVGNYSMQMTISDRQVRGRMLAVDRLDFGLVTWWRADFASEPLGGLLNRLALAPENILVPQALLEQTTIRLGDKVRLAVKLEDGFSYTGDFTVAGLYRHFPTVQADELVVIANLDHLFTQAGAEFNHQIWLRTDGTVTGKALFRSVQSQGVEAGVAHDARTEVAEEQAKLERVGIFGTLSLGFLAATLMAMLALLIHNYAALQERLYQFGVLRAIGLKHRQVVGQVALEYALLTAYGALLGATIGLTAAQAFTPFFRIPEASGAPLPPLIPIVAQGETLWFAASFAGLMILAELLSLLSALRHKLFAALRMGDVN